MLIIEKLALKKEITDEDIHNELYEICDREHASCNHNCPVYDCMSQSMRDNFKCPCFKDGKTMAYFIKTHITASN